MKVFILALLFYFLHSDVAAYNSYDCSNYVHPTVNSNNKLSPEEKKFMNCLGRDVVSGRSDLVVLIDRSGSMQSSGSFKGTKYTGYDVAKKFIKSLLSEVRIAYNATRIAVGTFGTDSTIDINYLKKPSYSNHKCKFNDDFATQLPGIDGWTNIKKSFEDAFVVFRDRQGKRPNTNKVVILLSDGEANHYDNGNYDPMPAATNLKSSGVILYTVAVTFEADQNSLKKWASSSKSSFLYSSSFDKMLTLAHNIRGGELYSSKNHILID